MNTRLSGATLSALLLLTLTAGGASAQFGGLPKPPKLPSVGGGGPSDAQRVTFRECEKATREGVDALPSTYGSNAPGRRKDLAKAEAALSKADAVCTPDLRIVSGWESTGERLEQLRVGVADGRHQVPLLERYEPLAKAYEAKQDIAAAELDALDKQVAAYTAWAPTAEHKRFASMWKDKADKLRANVASRQENQAARDAQAAEDREMLAKHDAIEGVAPILKALEEHAQKGEGPIPTELYERYEAQVKAIEAFNPTARLYYEPALRPYRAYDAWLAGAGAPQALAALYEGEVVASGASKGKAQKIAFKAQKDWCYLVITHFDERGAEEDLDFKDETKMRKALRFYDDETLKPWQRAGGFCANDAFAVDYGGKLTFTGTTNTQRWVAVGWPRDKFPASLAGRVRVWIDECDPVQYEERWLRPIPGTVDVRQPGDVKSWDKVFASASQCAIMPGTRTNPDANAYGACVERIYKSYAPRFNAAAKARDTAPTPGAYNAAVAKLDALGTQQEAELERSCGPTLKKIQGQFDAAVDRVADGMKGQAYSDHVDRAKRAADEGAGRARPAGKDGKPESADDASTRRFRMRQYEEYYQKK